MMQHESLESVTVQSQNQKTLFCSACPGCTTGGKFFRALHLTLTVPPGANSSVPCTFTLAVPLGTKSSVHCAFTELSHQTNGTGREVVPEYPQTSYDSEPVVL